MGEQRCFFARCFGAPVAGRDLAQGDPGRLALGTLLEEALQFLEPLMAAQASLPPLPVPPPQAWAPAAKACYLPALHPGPGRGEPAVPIFKASATAPPHPFSIRIGTGTLPGFASARSSFFRSAWSPRWT